jgi:hypothetical protein
MRQQLRRYWWALAVVVVIAIAIPLWLAHRGRQLPPARARVYTSFNACLLTDSQGVTSLQAAPVWAGMQAASLRTNGKVSYLSINGEDNESNAETYVNTLTQRQCTLILAVSDSPVAAVRTTATRFPSTRFAVVDNHPSTANITAIPAGTPKDVTATVQDLVTRAATQAAK